LLFYRPLPDEFIRYAQSDTHYLLYIYDRMKNELLDRANGRRNLVTSVFNASTLVCAKVSVLLWQTYMEDLASKVLDINVAHWDWKKSRTVVKMLERLSSDGYQYKAEPQYLCCNVFHCRNTRSPVQERTVIKTF